MSRYTSTSQVVRKPAVVSKSGIVAAQNRLAAEQGAKVLARGGNAIDAAVTTAFALAASEPWMSGLGGGGSMLIYLAKEDRVRVIDFGMIAPAALDPADYPLSGGVASDLFPWPAVVEDRNLLGAKSIAIPGAVDGLGKALEAYGTIAWRDAIQPAIDLAESGLSIDWFSALVIASSARDLSRFPSSAGVYLDSGFPPSPTWHAVGRAPTRELTGLAGTLKRLAEHGPREFYEGALAKGIAKDVQDAGGYLSEADLAGYQARDLEPLVQDYRGAKVYVPPELNGGPTMLKAFAEISEHNFDQEGPDANTYVAYAEALLKVYEERLATLGDADEARGDSCTTHLSAVDAEGNMVTLTTTLLSIFGSKLVLPASGILMNNGIMWFDPRSGHPNSLRPSKRCLANYSPTILQDDWGRVALGASGGRKIFPAIFQILSYIKDYGMTLDEAMHQARIDVSGTERVVIDAALPQAVRSGLARRFDTAETSREVFPLAFACPSAVLRRGDENQGSSEVMHPWSDAVSAESCTQADSPVTG
ncbi:gamma-glutamyltransferase [Pelagibius sp. Alg239-R121]|uniref:gamma-glutamyltransferase n=1 Tax=Pelagibius sp. Alg239-R121 TaxID=2993448 RepID=UPI0024A6D1BA|nr:gamma-glutamyltransferase [Pelagibius sp. Alg239-R121]